MKRSSGRTGRRLIPSVRRARESHPRHALSTDNSVNDLVDAICYEYLNRVLLLHPNVDLKYIDSLCFLPLTTLEITNLPQHNDMLPFPFPNPSSDRFPAPAPPKLEGQNARHRAIDERWLPGESTYNGVLRDSEGMFCPLPSCGEYDCQVHSQPSLSRL